MKNPQINLVKGYHAVTPVPEQCPKLGLNFRFAVVLQTFIPDYDYERLQLQLILDILMAIIKINAPLTLSITHQNGMLFTSVEEYVLYLESCDLEDMPFFFQIELKKDEMIFCLMVPELWDLIGGPSPYHDSYTFSFFTPQDMSEKFAAICEVVCLKRHIDITNRIDGEPFPIPAPIPKKTNIFIRGLKSIYYILTGVHW